MKNRLSVVGVSGLLLITTSVLAAEKHPDEVRVAYSGGSQVLVLAKADGSLQKALGAPVKWVQFASGADALNYFASNAIDIANFVPARRQPVLSGNCRWRSLVYLA